MVIDWVECDERLYAACIATIRQFAIEHPGAEVCFFAFDSEPRYGYVLLAFDTLENNIRTAKGLEAFAIGQRELMLRGEDAWHGAKHGVGSPVLAPFYTDSGGFAFSQYAEVTFREWQTAAEEGTCPVGPEWADDYLDSNARLAFWRVSERLIADAAFELLKLASPFMIGYGIHDEESAILRILNWPAQSPTQQQ